MVRAGKRTRELDRWVVRGRRGVEEERRAEGKEDEGDEWEREREGQRGEGQMGPE